MNHTPLERYDAVVYDTATSFLEQAEGSPFARRLNWHLDDELVQGLCWLNDYFRVWLYRGPGLGYLVGHPAAKDAHQFYLDVLEKSAVANFNDDRILRPGAFGHNCTHHRPASAPLNQREFERLCAANATERSRLYAEFIATVRRT